MSIMDVLRTNEKKQSECQHSATTSTVNFGLERVVCQICGKVEMRHLDTADPGVLFQIPADK